MKVFQISLVIASLALAGCNKSNDDNSTKATNGSSAKVTVPVTSVTAPAKQPAGLPADTSVGTPANPAGIPSENEAMPASTGVDGKLINSGTDTIDNGTGSLNNDLQKPSKTDNSDQD